MVLNWRSQLLATPGAPTSTPRPVRTLRAPPGLRFPCPSLAILRCSPRGIDSCQLHLRNQCQHSPRLNSSSLGRGSFIRWRHSDGALGPSSILSVKWTHGRSTPLMRSSSARMIWRCAWGPPGGAPAFSYSVEQPRHVRSAVRMALNDVERQNDAAYENPYRFSRNHGHSTRDH